MTAEALVARAWCYACNAPQPMVGHGLRVIDRVALREGRCAVCGGPTWRVGGARGSDA